MRTLPKLLMGAAALDQCRRSRRYGSQLPRDDRLPAGRVGVERIFYTGDTPPQVTLPAASPVAYAADPFVVMQRISAEMDRETAAMMGQADAMMVDPMATAPLGAPDHLMTVNMGDLPTAARSYSFVSTMSGNGVCSRSVQITSRGDGARLTVVNLHILHGNCAAVPARRRHRPCGSPWILAAGPLAPNADRNSCGLAPRPRPNRGCNRSARRPTDSHKTGSCCNCNDPGAGVSFTRPGREECPCPHPCHHLAEAAPGQRHGAATTAAGMIIAAAAVVAPLGVAQAGARLSSRTCGLSRSSSGLLPSAVPYTLGCVRCACQPEATARSSRRGTRDRRADGFRLSRRSPSGQTVAGDRPGHSLLRGRHQEGIAGGHTELGEQFFRKGRRRGRADVFQVEDVHELVSVAPGATIT